MDPVALSTSNRDFVPRDASAALTVSALSVGWTVLAGAAAISLGLSENSAVLVAFGSIGFVDAIGSVALIHHFRHGLRTEELSDRLERLAHRIVLVGLTLVGLAAIVGGSFRWATHQVSGNSVGAAVLAAASLIGLTLLAGRKVQVARRVSSGALMSDGHLSGVGAAQALVAVLGTAAARWLGWHSADATTTVIVGSVALAVAVRAWWTESRSPGPATSAGTQSGRVPDPG